MSNVLEFRPQGQRPVPRYDVWLETLEESFIVAQSLTMNELTPYNQSPRVGHYHIRRAS